MTTPWPRAFLDALEGNDYEECKAAFGRALSNINCRVDANLKYQGEHVSGKAVRGDTILHLAMREQKWNARRACVELGIDASIRNSDGWSAPGMQLFSSAPKLLGCFLIFAFTMWVPEVFDEFSETIATATFYLCSFMLFITGADCLLAVRWYVTSRFYGGKYYTSLLAQKKLAAAKEEKARRKAAEKAR